MVPGKMVPEKNRPRKNGPRKKWSPENSETKNRGAGVEHRGVCVCGMLGCDQSMKTQNSTTIISEIF